MTKLLISISIEDLPENWEKDFYVQEIGSFKTVETASFDSLFIDFIFSPVASITTGMLANWLYSKFNSKGGVIKINGKRIDLSNIDELQEEIDKLSNKMNKGND